MGILAGRNSRMRASSHRISIFVLVIIKAVNTSCHELASKESSFTTAKLARHRSPLGGTWAIEWRDDVKLLKRIVRSIAQRAEELTCSEVLLLWEDMNVGLI